MAFLTIKFQTVADCCNRLPIGLFGPFLELSHLRTVATGRDRSAPQTLHPAPRRSSRERADQFATTGSGARTLAQPRVHTELWSCVLHRLHQVDIIVLDASVVVA